MVTDIAEKCVQPARWSADIEAFTNMIIETAQPGDHILVMSNGGFSGIHGKLLAGLKAKSETEQDD
ncbi:UDP-N-acetylmuramate:L-alanyl-gamma-D-glutamyl-meso-diaminopimelate ligase, partial [Escherichia coli]|nr:UDP-N-acetylmuramate:L-alanyl-gamma-D-glutamyl-meso-diaminopimelate ligase [Escherichia coli]